MNKKLTFLLALTFLFLFSSGVFGDDFQDFRDHLDAVNAYQKEDYKTAHRLWLPLAEQGNADAQYNLGKIYEKGRVVQQDYKEAVKWYKRAETMLRGFIYNNGHQCFVDCDHHVRYPEALYNLGLMYAKGHGVSKDYVIAHSWFNSAATFGEHEGSKNWLNKLEKEMTPQQIEEAKKHAMSMNRMSSHAGYTELKFY
ncbi:MAG TPA: sel1 repeat family protein [Phycisphaerales bacterium]|nr:sel1 repeat family protein [Phycisphaerales bacterium]